MGRPSAGLAGFAGSGRSTSTATPSRDVGRPPAHGQVDSPRCQLSGCHLAVWVRSKAPVQVGTRPNQACWSLLPELQRAKGSPAEPGHQLVLEGFGQGHPHTKGAIFSWILSSARAPCPRPEDTGL